MADAYDFWAERLPSAERAAVHAFWEGFARHAAFIDAIFTGEDRSGTADDVADCMADALGPLSDGIYWEFGPLDETGKRGHFLALTPELYHSKRPLARALVAAAPDLPGWGFGDARRPMAADASILANVASRAFRDVTLLGAEVQAGAHRMVDVTGLGPDEHAGGQAGLLFSLVMGEAVERDWLGEVSSTPAKAPRAAGLAGMIGRRAAPEESWVSDFAEEARGLVDAMRAGTQTAPFAPVRGSVPETLFRLTPGDGTWPRADLVTYLTTRPDFAQARFDDAPIAAERFSTRGESFIALRLARTPAAPLDDVSDRAEIADAIDADLRAGGLGGVFGEGHGRAHIYVDAAVTEIPSAIGVIERVLGRLGHSAPAHILFDEAGLTDLALPLASHQALH